MELLLQVGLDERHAGVFPRALSGGQQQRIAIALALASQPRVLILDEAVASLDVSAQAQVLNLLADIREQTHVTYLFISHDLAVVRQVSDEVVVMRHGTIVERGTASQVLRRSTKSLHAGASACRAASRLEARAHAVCRLAEHRLCRSFRRTDAGERPTCGRGGSASSQRPPGIADPSRGGGLMPALLETMRPAALDPAAEQIMVPMRDGVRLATDVYLPPRPGRLPAVLVRLPYDKCGRYTFMPQCAPYFTERGYAFVVQDVRGKFRSEGERCPSFTRSTTATTLWSGWPVKAGAMAASVCSGNSCYGYTQWAAVASGHPALKAIVPRVTSSDLKVLSSWWGDSVVQLYGADYLAHYWADPLIYFFEVDWAQRPLAAAFDDGFAAIGARSAGLDAMVHLTGPGGIAEYPTGTRSTNSASPRCTRSAGSTTLARTSSRTTPP